MDFFKLFTPVSYWILIALWLFIFLFYINRILKRNLKSQLFFTLLTILAIDAFRTLFESIYFGAWYTSLVGFIPKSIHDFLVRPENVFIPKILNVIAAFLIIFIVLRRWLPEEEAEREKETEHIKLLLQSEKRLIDAQNLSKIGHYVLDVKSGFWTSSPELDTIFGIEKDFKKNVGGWKQIVHPDHQEELLGYLYDHVLKKHQKFDKEYKIINQKNQKEYWVHGMGDLKLDAEGNVVEMLGTIQDITERRKMEQDLRESREIMSSILNNTQDIIVRIDRNFQHIFANPALYAATGLTPEEYIGKTNEEIGMPEKLSRLWRNKHKNIFKTGKPDIFEFSTLTQNRGERIFQAAVNPEFSKGGEVDTIISFMRDITELKQVEAEKNTMITKLEQTLSEVKTLRGLIPICSNCKKIRDDQGYWNNLETYLEKYSDASFSHGLCTECSDKLYGKEEWYIKMKNKGK